ncbi:mitochondrial inner membrane protein OXA1L-like [Alligator sinensis]|uniref:Mitochondrial inner membrane protein OXA1L-like n=1 Tax=Alligator sinensis TaxID=38654 RepID=A0A3Q0FPT6_ALLSI|nr:mitochondrial inner membrane protein OXA1L-like [Alligator sinensis]
MNKVQGLGLLDAPPHLEQLVMSQGKEQASRLDLAQCPLEGPAFLKGGHHPPEDRMLEFKPGALQRQTHSSTILPTWLHGRTQQGTPLALGSRAQSTAAASTPVLSAASLVPPVTPIPGTELAVPGLGPELELSLSELGLASYTPVGLIQTLLESLHVHLGLPWWGAIVAGTVVVRCLVFPLIVKGQREAVKINNHMPQITRLTNVMNEARCSGNQFEFNRAYMTLMTYRKDNNINPMYGFVPAFVQAPVFISFFIALREMTDLPVPSMQSGGLAWFPDLTIADPFYILPLVATGSAMTVMQLATEGDMNNPNLKLMTRVFSVVPLIILPFTFKLSTAVFTYWLTSNTLSLVQVGLLRLPVVRTWLRIPQRVEHKPNLLPKREGFFKNLKTGWKNAALAQKMEEREQRIKNRLALAAKAPLRQTFSYNPLKPQEDQTGSNTPTKQPERPWRNPFA